MLFSYPAISQVFFLIITIFFAIILLILLAPFCLSLDLGKKESLVWGRINLTWLCLTIFKQEISHKSIEDLLTSTGREKDEKNGTDGNGGDEWQDVDKLSKVGETAVEGKTDGSAAEKNEAVRKSRPSPSFRSLIDAAPALAELLGDLARSIRIKKFSCRLCFGLDDPAQTAIISGYIWFFASLLGVSLADLIIEPWFDGLRLEGTLDAEIRARLFSPIWAAVKSLRRKEIRQIVREMLG